MSNKSKGSNAERELVKIFTEHGWRALRAAGSGVNDDSPCDIIVGKIGKRGFAIEAKSSRKDSIYISKSQIEDFIRFAHMIGLNAAIAVKFSYEGWIFITPDKLKDSGKFWVVSRKSAVEQGRRFSQFFEDTSPQNILINP